MNTAQAIGSGLAGAVVLTALHEGIKQIAPESPRMDQIGTQIVKKAKGSKIDDESAYNQALAGELVANSLLYSLVGYGEKNSWMRGLLIGAGSGLAAVLLPKVLPVSDGASNRTSETTAMTIGLYTLAGLAAAGMSTLFRNAQKV
ncbi:hypothetical protein BH23BAC1_BH23BAC1_50930 [soil metagenome]